MGRKNVVGIKIGEMMGDVITNNLDLGSIKSNSPIVGEKENDEKGAPVAYAGAACKAKSQDCWVTLKLPRIGDGFQCVGASCSPTAAAAILSTPSCETANGL